MCIVHLGHSALPPRYESISLLSSKLLLATETTEHHISPHPSLSSQSAGNSFISYYSLGIESIPWVILFWSSELEGLNDYRGKVSKRKEWKQRLCCWPVMIAYNMQRMISLSLYKPSVVARREAFSKMLEVSSFVLRDVIEAEIHLFQVYFLVTLTQKNNFFFFSKKNNFL